MADTAKVAYVFPGQGSQRVGMGKDLYDAFPAAKAVFDRADEVLGVSLARFCFEGPEEELRQTINAQPALVTASYACLEAIREAAPGILPSPAFVAGHSLGEYTALGVAGVFDFPTAVRLARERGRLMHEAGQQQPGSMAAIMGMDEARLAEVCRPTDVQIANINCPGQLVISGAREKVAQAIELAKANGAARAIPLAVSGAFHTPLMQPAYQGMAEFIRKLSFRDPQIAVVANTTARPLRTAAEVKNELLEQLCHCVQWQRSVEYMAGQGVNTFYEIGPGKVLTGLIKRIIPEAATVNIGDLAAVRGLASQ